MGFSVLEKPATTCEAQYDGKQGQDDSVREWGVVADSAPVTADQARSFAASIARIGDIHPFNPAKICVDVSVKQTSAIIFDVTATYRVPIFQGGKSKSPLEQAAKITYDWAISEEPIDVDADGKPIVMATGEKFDPPIRRPFGDLVVTVERNVAQFDAKSQGDLLFCTNSDTWLGLPPGTALLTKLQAVQTLQSDGSSYTTRTSSVQYRSQRDPKTPVEKSWWHRQLALSYHWKLQSYQQTLLLGHTNGKDKSVFKVFLSDGSPSSIPLAHSPQTGQPYLTTGTTTAIDYDHAPEPYYFKIYKSKPFSNAQIF